LISAGALPDPAWGGYSAPPDPLVGFQGTTSNGKGGEGKEGEEREGNVKGSRVPSSKGWGWVGEAMGKWGKGKNRGRGGREQLGEEPALPMKISSRAPARRISS